MFESFHDLLFNYLNVINGVLWHEYVLYTLLGVGLLFTLWSGFCQYRALTHGTEVIRGKYDDKNDPGAINHFQALSAALSATVGLGNFGGVAVAISIGGPGAVFWMWMVGIVGMALKLTEVTLSMLYRNTDDPDNPHGGPMWVAQKGFQKMGLGALGSTIGAIFCVTLLISTVTGGNMFQSWNVADVTQSEFGLEQWITGVILAGIVAVVIIGGIKRIGAVAGRLVPFMCVTYLVAALVVLALNIGQVPEMLIMIVKSAFNPTEAQGAFLGGTFAGAISWGMKRALFSSEAGQGSSPIAHSAAKTDEPVREGVVAGLEPFVDTIVVCTLTSLVILSSGAWNRNSNGVFDQVDFVEVAEQEDGSLVETVGTGNWLAKTDDLPLDAETRDQGWARGPDRAFLVAQVVTEEGGTPSPGRISGTIEAAPEGNSAEDDPASTTYPVTWTPIASVEKPVIKALDSGGYAVFRTYTGASLTSHAFNRVLPGLGTYLVVFASWLFAISTMISWSYYGEQGVIYLFGDRSVIPYKIIYCLLIVAAALPQLISTETELDILTTLGTGVMLWANIPIMLIFGSQGMRAYHDYFKRMKAESAARSSKETA